MEICRHITVSKFGKEPPEATPKEIKQNEEVIDPYFAER
jgi:ABC-type branched-subunit amino acid transport system ATPase component